MENDNSRRMARPDLPALSNTIHVIWEDIDYMFIDMPPGTGDVSLTVLQSIPIDGLIGDIAAGAGS